MTGGDNNVSNVKMHSSQRNRHPTKRKKSLQTRLLIHVHHKQMVLEKDPDWFSVVLLRSLDWCAPHSLSQTTSTDKKQAWQEQHLWGGRGGREGGWGERVLKIRRRRERKRERLGRGWWRYSRMVKSITWDAKQKTGCSYISLFFPIKKDRGMQEAGVRGGQARGRGLMGRGLSRWKRHSLGQEAR